MVLVHLHKYPYSLFRVVVMGSSLLVTNLTFLLASGAMAELYSFNDVVNGLQSGQPQKKHKKKQLVKAALLSQCIGSSQSTDGSQVVDAKVILLLTIVPTVPTP